MSSFSTNPLFMVQEVADKVERRAELIGMSRHRIDRDNGIVVVLSGWLTTESHPSSGRAIPAMVDGEAGDEESLGIDREVGHRANVVAVEDGSGVFCGLE